MAKVDYDKYLRRLQAKRADSPYYKAFRMQQANTALTQQSLDQQMRARLQSTGSSAGATEQAHQSLQQSALASTQTAWGQMATAEDQRRSEIDSRIDSLQMAKDQQEAAEREAREAKRGGLLKSIASFGGAALGAVAGTIIAPGAGTMLGAQIGGGIGGMGGSFIGGDGKMSLNNFNPEEFMQGFQDTAGSIAGALTLKSQKQSMGQLSELLSAKRGTMKSEDWAWISGLIGSGDIEGVIEYLNKLGTGKTGPYDINWNGGGAQHG